MDGRVWLTRKAGGVDIPFDFAQAGFPHAGESAGGQDDAAVNEPKLHRYLVLSALIVKSLLSQLRRELMKKIALFILATIFGIACAVPAYAQYHTNGKAEARAARKAEKKQQKAQRKYAKAQRKAQRKMIKKDRKNTKLPSHY